MKDNPSFEEEIVLEVIHRRRFFLWLQVREAYKTYMKKVAKLLGGGNDSDAQMMKVFELETTLATVNAMC